MLFVLLVWHITQVSDEQRNVLALMEQDSGKKMGCWEKLMHPIVKKPYYKNTQSSEIVW
jgi:hypothetical protein